jgi:transcription antitermination factor NusG
VSTEGWGQVAIPQTECSVLSNQRWYVAYTRANHEKRVFDQLIARSLEACLPTYKSLRRWSDRSKVIEVPLFRGYVFIRIPDRLFQPILMLPGVAHLVGSSSGPTPLSDAEVNALREAQNRKVELNPYPFMTKGMRVRVKRGAFQDREGFLLRTKDYCRVVISLPIISSSFVLEVDISDVEVVNSHRNRNAA